MALLAMLCLTGCDNPPSQVPTTSTALTNPIPRSGAGGVVDALTGKTTIEAGLRTMKKVEEINSNEQKRLEEAMKP